MISRYAGDRFTALSSDTKPTGVVDGAILFELDTKYIYVKISGSWTETSGSWAGAGGSYTDEQAQDAIGSILIDSSTVTFTYNDATPTITAAVIQTGLSIMTSQIPDITGYVTVPLFTGHTGDTSVHFTQASISITESQISDLGIYALDSSLTSLQNNFTGHTGDSSLHYTQSEISITESQISDLGTYAVASDLTNLNSVVTGHTGDSTIHFTQSAISITESQISDLGDYATNTALTNLNAVVTGHTGNSNIHFTQTEISITESQISDLGDYATNGYVNSISGTFTGHTGDSSIHYTQASISITESQISDLGTYTDLSLFTGHTGDNTIHFTQASISITESQISDLGVYALDSNLTNLNGIVTGHTGNTSIHFTQSEISITESQISDLGDYATNVALTSLNSIVTGHTGDSSIHFTQASISITESQISDLGNYALDSSLTSLNTLVTGHTGDSSIHFTQGSISITESQISDFGSYALSSSLSSLNTIVTGHTGTSNIHFTEASIDHDNILNAGTYTHAELDEHYINTFNPHNVTAAQVGSPTTAVFTGHTGDTDIHVTTIDRNNWDSKHFDFNLEVAYTTWSSAAVGSATKYTASQQYFSHTRDPKYISWGILDTNTTAVGDQGIIAYNNNRGYYLSPGRGYEFYFSFNNTSAITSARLGFWGNDNSTWGTAQITGRPTYAAYLDYTKASSSNFIFYANDGTTTATYDSGITVSGAKVYVFGVVMNSSGYLDFYMPSESGSTIIGTATSGVVSGAAPQVGTLFYSIYKDNTAGATRGGNLLTRVTFLSQSGFGHEYIA